MMQKKRSCLSSYIVLLNAIILMVCIAPSTQLSAQEQCKLYGKITNQNGEPVPYTAIYIEELQRSSMANEDGEFQISLPQGKYDLIFQNLSYETKIQSIEAIGTEKEMPVQMRSIAYALKEVEVDPSSEDPAYNIMRKAMAMSEYYKRQRESFKAELYARTAVNIDDIPWLAEKFAEEDDIKEMKAGYIVETLAEYTYEKGGKVTERIIAQKTARKDTNNFGSNYVNLDFYDLGSSSGIVNPISRSSFSVYKFEYQASLFEGEQKIHKIKVIPRRKGNDLMAGEIFINDQLWNINKVNVNFQGTGTKVNYKQLYREIRENVWFPMNHQIEWKVKLLGFKLDVRYLASIKQVEIETDPQVDLEIKNKIAIQRAKIYSTPKEEIAEEKKPAEASKKDEKTLTKFEKREQKINDLIEKENISKAESLKLYRMVKKQQEEIEAANDTIEDYELTSNRTVVYDDSARANNDSLWQADRQIPLTSKDKSIYKKSDSIKKVDDGDTIVNKKRSPIGNLFFYDGRINTKNKNVIFRPKGLIVGLGGYFNTVDGYSITKSLFYFEKNKKKGIYYHFEPTLGYAFARDRIIGDAKFTYQYCKQSASRFILDAGSVSEDFNGEYSMSQLDNTVATLFFKENFPKFYQRNYIDLQHRSDIGNKLELSLGIEYNDRERLENNSSQHLSLVGKKEYSDNLPEHLDILNDPNIIDDHQSGIIKAEISYQNKRYYRFYDGKKSKRNSESPKFYVGYQQGIPDLFDSDVQFSLLKGGIQRSFSYRLIDRISYMIEGGAFLNNDQLYFADYQAFNINPFEFSFNSVPNAFALLPYYAFNSSDYYIRAHSSLRNNFILLKYLPLLNTTQWKEEIGFSYLYTEREQHYYEFSYGLSQILLVLDVKAYVNFLDHEYQDFGLRLSFYLGGN